MKLFEIIIIILILASAVFMGTPIKYNAVPLNLVIIAIGIIFIMYNVLYKKKKIIESKLDISILVLCLSPIIPLIFGTYISFNDTIEYLLKYLSCFSIYIILKPALKSNPKLVKIITNILIICSIILIIIGIDYMTTKISYIYLEKLGIPHMENFGKVMASSLGNSNSLAIILAVSIMLIIDKLANEKKSIYFLALFLNLSMLILTYSRGAWLFLLIFFIINLIQQEPQKRIYIIYSTLLAGIVSIVYIILWYALKEIPKLFIVWEGTLAMCIACFLFFELFNKLYERIIKIKKKNIIIATIIFLIIVISVFILGLKFPKPLYVFQEGSKASVKNYEIENIEANTEYSFKFDINAKAKENEFENYTIIVREENKYHDEVKEHLTSFNNFTGIKEIKFTTSKDTIRATVILKSANKIWQEGLTINEFTINDKLHPLKYLYLPNKLVDKINSISLKDKSVWERGIYYKDAIKIIKNNPLVGQGGNSWKYYYKYIQEYNYITIEPHSYPLQLFMDYGIIAITSLISIIIIVLLKKKNIYVTALFLLLTHSFMDFDMSFFYIMVLAFVLLAIIASDEKEKEKNTLIDKIVPIVLIAILLGAGIMGILQYNKEELDQKEMIKLIDSKKANEVIDIIREKQKEEKYIFYYWHLESLDYSNVSDENLKYMYEVIKETPINYDIEENLKRNEIISSIIKTTTNQEIKEKFKNILIDENEKSTELILNKEKNRLTDSSISDYLYRQKEIYNQAFEN